MPKFSVEEPSTDGVDSGKTVINPSKSSLIFIYALVNKYKLKILTDTGATKTFISSRILHQIAPMNSIVKQPYSFLLADGIAPFHVLGLVDLSIQFNCFNTTIKAHVAQHLSADMIVGMDFINKYNMNINVMQQIVTIELNNQRTIVPIVNEINVTKIPVVSSNNVVISPYATRKISVSVPISSISLPFTPLYSFQHQILVTNKNRNLQFLNYHCDIVLYNIMQEPKLIRKGACIGYLLCGPKFQQPRTFYSSCYKPLGTTKHIGMTPASSNLNTIGNSSIHSSQLNQNCISTCNSYSRSSREEVATSSKLFNPTVINYLKSLLENVQNNQQKQELLSLLIDFYDIFDITRQYCSNSYTTCY